MSMTLDTSNLATLTTATNSTAVLAFTDEGPKKLPLATIDSFRKLRLIPGQGQNSGWIRIGKFDTEGEAIVLMFGRWGGAEPQTACLVAQAHINGGSTVNKVCNLLAATSDSGFNKARLVKTSGSSSLFLDVYMAKRFSQMYFTLLDAVNFTQLSPAFAPELEATQSTFESSLLQSGGG